VKIVPLSSFLLKSNRRSFDSLRSAAVAQDDGFVVVGDFVWAESAKNDSTSVMVAVMR
jgi:hypothetical protein